MNNWIENLFTFPFPTLNFSNFISELVNFVLIVLLYYSFNGPGDFQFFFFCELKLIKLNRIFKSIFLHQISIFLFNKSKKKGHVSHQKSYNLRLIFIMNLNFIYRLSISTFRIYLLKIKKLKQFSINFTCQLHDTIFTGSNHIINTQFGNHFTITEFANNCWWWIAALFLCQFVTLQCHNTLHFTTIDRFLIKLFA